MSFRASDTVKHRPSGETWILACDQDGDYVYPAGWPESRAEAKDCELVEAADNDQRHSMLVNASKITHSDMRCRLASRQLARLASAPGEGK